MHYFDRFSTRLRELRLSKGLQTGTGGKAGRSQKKFNPLLCDNFFDTLRYLNSNYRDRITIEVIGNSYHVTEDIAKRMADLVVFIYQISLDGLEKIHDEMRSPGSFKDAIRALEVLHNNGIETVVSFTLSRTNMDELIPLA